MTTSANEAAAASRLMEMAIAHWGAELLLQAAEMSLADKFTGDAPGASVLMAAPRSVSRKLSLPANDSRPSPVSARK